MPLLDASLTVKSCPICTQEPAWYYARNCTMTRKVRCFILCGCPHAEAFGSLSEKVKRIVTQPELAQVENDWDAHAEKLFVGYTDRWTDPQRTAFRARLWPEPVKAELFDRNHDELPAYPFRHNVEAVEVHPFE